MENPEVAQVFEEIADLLEIQGANPFRVRAYRNVARIVRDLSTPLARMAASAEKQLEQINGIGKDLAEKIRTILDTGDLPLRQELRSRIPSGLREMLNISSLGARRAAILHRELGISTLDDLRKAAEEHRIREIRGFGAKTEESILKSLEGIGQSGGRIYLAEAKVTADSVVRFLGQASELRRIEVAGSYRRRRETVGDLDVLVTCAIPGPVMDRLAAYEGTAEVMARGDTKMTVRLRNRMQLDLRVVAENCFGAALVYFTGSKAHNTLLRRRALDRGLKLNEYGLFREEQRVAGETEAAVYAALDLPWIPPELREGRGEIEAAVSGTLPHLLEREDLRGDLHMHTTATDGRASLIEMVEGARKRGYDYIAITDHSKRVTVARGLDAAGVRNQWKTMEQLGPTLEGITLLKSIEVDILEDGSLDLPNEVLSEADWVVASLHFGQKQPKEQITRRLIKAIENPYVSVIGHPTGRRIGKRPPYELDIEGVMNAAAAHGCFLELNSQPARLDLDDVSLAAARARGIPVVLSSDAHSVEELGFVEYGTYQARRAGLEARDIANTRSLEELRRMSRPGKNSGRE
jgi:DNA polymerase (family 10)